MIWENFKMAFRSISSNKLRTALTMLGLIIGISAVVVINAVGEGVKNSVADQAGELGTNLIQVNPGGGSTGFESIAASFGTSTLNERDVEIIRGIEGVEAAAPAMIVSGIADANGKKATGSIMFATTPDYARAIKTDMEFGSFLPNDKDNKIVIGYKAADNLFGTPSPETIGKKVTIRNEEFEVVGVTKKPEEGKLALGPGLDSIIYLPLEAGKRFNNGNVNINEIEVKASNPDQVGPVKERIREKLQEAHGGQVDFSASDAAEQLKIFDSILGLLTTFVAAIASIALLVGGIGIMNIMLVSVTERTHEIGLRKALGATRSTILGQFLIEAIVICLLGGLLGVAFAYAGAFGVGKLAGIDPVVTMPAIIYAVTASVAVGVIFGVAPAIKAARMRPIEALRYE